MTRGSRTTEKLNLNHLKTIAKPFQNLLQEDTFYRTPAGLCSSSGAPGQVQELQDRSRTIRTIFRMIRRVNSPNSFCCLGNLPQGRLIPRFRRHVLCNYRDWLCLKKIWERLFCIRPPKHRKIDNKLAGKFHQNSFFLLATYFFYFGSEFLEQNA